MAKYIDMLDKNILLHMSMPETSFLTFTYSHMVALLVFLTFNFHLFTHGGTVGCLLTFTYSHMVTL